MRMADNKQSGENKVAARLAPGGSSALREIKHIISISMIQTIIRREAGLVTSAS